MIFSRLCFSVYAFSVYQVLAKFSSKFPHFYKIANIMYAQVSHIL